VTPSTEGVVFTNGCFDILHIGHLRLLQYAKQNGSTLIVGIDSDERVKRMKGPARPINSAADRVEMLNALRFVDQVHVFGTDQELRDLISSIAPEVLVVGSDWKGREIIGAEHAKRVDFFRRINGLSTTNTISRIIGVSER
jgi:rfaE bifunctional protein nucleotidyltransferase chain/domain